MQANLCATEMQTKLYPALQFKYWGCSIFIYIPVMCTQKHGFDDAKNFDSENIMCAWFMDALAILGC